MSGTNFIHGIVVIGAITIAATVNNALAGVIAVIAVFLGTLNVVGGWVVTDRMLGMFRGTAQQRRPQTAEPPARGRATGGQGLMFGAAVYSLPRPGRCSATWWRSPSSRAASRC